MAQFGNHRPFSGHKIFINWFIRNLIQNLFYKISVPQPIPLFTKQKKKKKKKSQTSKLYNVFHFFIQILSTYIISITSYYRLKTKLAVFKK
jgi:hypothetical protein